ncbi:hypothetical protein P9112_014004 [Eukaryota sp. TZLM1-RC]
MTSLTNAAPVASFPETNVIKVKKLIKHIHPYNLQKVFAVYGTVAQLRVSVDNNEPRFYFALVCFETMVNVDQIVAELNEANLCGSTIQVLPARPNNKFLNRSSPANIFLDNFPVTMNEEDLRNKCLTYGTVKSVHIIRYQGNSKGKGFCNFLRPQDASNAVAAIHDQQDWGCGKVRASVTESGQKPKPYETSLYVQNLPDDMEEDGVNALFSRYGKVTSTKVIRAEGSGISLGCAYVTFSTPLEAINAMDALHQTLYEFKPLKVQFYQQKPARMPIKTPNTSVTATPNGTQTNDDLFESLSLALYERVSKTDEEHAGKIVGIFRTLELSELKRIHDDPQHYNEKLNEVKAALAEAL